MEIYSTGNINIHCAHTIRRLKFQPDLISTKDFTSTALQCEKKRGVTAQITPPMLHLCCLSNLNHLLCYSTVNLNEVDA